MQVKMELIDWAQALLLGPCSSFAGFPAVTKLVYKHKYYIYELIRSSPLLSSALEIFLATPSMKFGSRPEDNISRLMTNLRSLVTFFDYK